MTLSYNWILTSIGILIEVIALLLLITLYINIVDVGIILQFIVISAFVVYICYINEFTMKMEYLKN